MTCCGSSPSPREPAAADIVGLDYRASIPATWLLVLLLVLVHAVTAVWEWRLGLSGLVDGLLFERDLRFRVSAGGQLTGPIYRGEAWRLWTSVCLHVDIWHLLINASGVYVLGRLLEPWLGPVRLWAWFWFGGLSGSLLSYFAGVPQSDGASGAAYALLGAAAVLGHQLRAQLPDDDRRLMGPVLLILLVLNLIASVILPSIDGIAHVGGLMVGIVLARSIGLWRHRAVRVVEWVWLLVCLVACGLGWAIDW